MKEKLTAGRVAKWGCEPKAGKQAFLWDTVVQGLAVRATAKGAKSYVFQSKLNGGDIRVTIGAVTAWDIESGDPAHPGAREEARRLQRLIDGGIDPREHRAASDKKKLDERAERKHAEITIGEIWPVYIAVRSPAWGARHLLDHQRLVAPGGVKAKRGERITEPGALFPLMSVRLVDLDADRVELWLASEAKTRPTQARLAFSALRAFVGWCAESKTYGGITDADAVGSKVAAKTLPKKGRKQDCLDADQLAPWFDAVRSLPSKVVRTYLQVLLLTGARREEIASMQWKDVDFRWKKITIKDKVQGTRTIPLTPYVSHILHELPRIADNPWVFTSAKAKSGRLQDPSSAHAAACERARIDGLTLHGLRRSFSTLSEWEEVPAGITAQIMGHAPSATAEKHYKVRPADILRLWHSRIEGWILNAANVEFRDAIPPRHLRVAA